MNWEQFKEHVDKEIAYRDLEPQDVEIDRIDIGWVDEDDIEVGITMGSDGRLELTISS